MDNNDRGKPKAPPAPDTRTRDDLAPLPLEPEFLLEPEDKKNEDHNNPALLTTGFKATNAQFRAGSGKDDDDADKKARRAQEQQAKDFTDRQIDYLISANQQDIRRLERQLNRIDRDIQRENVNASRLREELQRQQSVVEKAREELEEAKEKEETLTESQRELNRMASHSEMNAEEAAKALAKTQADPQATEDGSERYITAEGRIVDERGVETDDSKKMSAEMRQQILESPDKGGLKSFEEFQTAKAAEEKQRLQAEQIKQAAKEQQEKVKQQGAEVETRKSEVVVETKKIAEIEKEQAATETRKELLQQDRVEVAKDLQEAHHRKKELEALQRQEETGNNRGPAVASRTSASEVGSPAMKAVDEKLKTSFNIAADPDSPAPASDLKRRIAPAPAASGPANGL